MSAVATAASPASPYMTKREAAAYTRQSVRSLDRWKDLPRIKRNGRVLFRKEALDAAMLANEAR